VDLFTFIILLATLSTLVPYVFCSLAELVTPGGARQGAGRLVGAFAFLYAFVAVIGAGAEVVYWGFVLLIAGLPVYVWVVRSRAADTGAAQARA
jgi:hypothetical protein